MAMETQQQDSAGTFAAVRAPSVFWIIVAASSCLALFFVFFMVVQGYRDGLQRGQAQKRQHVAILLQRASDYLDEGRRQEALAAYNSVLQLDARNASALHAISTVEAMPTAAAEPVEQTGPSPIELEWNEALAQLGAGNLEEAIARFLRIQAAQPDFRTEEAIQALFSAYVELGRKRAGADQLEVAVQLFDSALELRPTDSDVRNERNMTAGYVDVKTYWGADWSRAIGILEKLYQRDPGFRNVEYLLQRAHVEFGDSLASEGAWCAAVAEYTSAIAVLDWMELRVKREGLAARCEAEMKSGAARSGAAIAGASPSDRWQVALA